ncbi:Transcription initiation factor TFIID subunit 7 [Glycine soja]
MVIVMEEQFILRVPPNVAERIECLLNENNAPSSEDKSLDLSFSEDGRSGTFMIGNEHFAASLLDLPCVVESYNKTYDDNSLIKTADIGQMIMVRESGDAAPDVIEYRHGLTPPMRDARKRRFRREPDLNPELVSRVEKDLLKIMAGGTADNLDILTSLFVSNSNLAKFSILKYKSMLSLKLVVIVIVAVAYFFPFYLFLSSLIDIWAEQEEGDENARGANKKAAPKPAPKHDAPENLTNAGELDRSDSEESDDSV